MRAFKGKTAWVGGLMFVAANLVGCAPVDGEPGWDAVDASMDEQEKSGSSVTSCAVAKERSSLALSCAAGGTISAINFASYGLPSGSCATGPQTNTTCHAASSKTQVEAACLGKASCNVSASNAVFGDPCAGKGKSLAVTFTCTSGGGASPSCTQAQERSAAALSCTGGATISAIGFASYGLPSGSCATGFQASATCHATSSQQAVETTCLGKASCSVPASNSVFGDPCAGKAKSLAVTYSCSGGGSTGGTGNQGTLTVMDGSSNIGQITQRFELPGHVAPTRRWTQRTNGLCGNSCRNGPRHMYSAAFNDTLLVSWMSADETNPWKHHGNVATFKVGSDGKFTFVDNVSFKGKCEATYGITTSQDGSVIAVLCRAEPGVQAKLPGTIDLLATRRNPTSCNGTWEGTCYPIGNYSGQDSALYVLEYTGGKVTATPSSTVLVNHAVGGWNYGHHELQLNAAGDTYFVHLKVTAGPSATNRHEGLTHFGLRRKPSFEYVRLTDFNGWSCGSGHVTANRMAYNQYQDGWSQLCMLDSCPNRSQYANGKCNSISFATVPGVTKPQTGKYELEYLLELDQRSAYEMTGGVSTLLSLGADGWLALAAGPGYASALTTPDTIGFMQIPLTMTQLRERSLVDTVPRFEGGTRTGDQQVARYQWNWLYLPASDPALARTKRVGMAAMAYFDVRGEGSQRLLAGWSPSIAFQAITPEYVVSEIDRTGRLRGQPYRVKNAGWGEDNRWTTMPSSGCVVFPFAWVGDAPGRDYPIESNTLRATDLPRALHLTSLCPRGGTPNLAPTPAAKTDKERWPTAQ